MFQVRGRDLHPRTKYDGHTYTVYAVNQTDSVLTLAFLIWSDGRWVWERAELFEPIQ